MRRHLVLFCVVALSLNGVAAFAQAVSPTYQPTRFDLSPLLPSPKVAKLGTYGDIPVDNFTGVPDIKIPLYTYEFNGLSLPVYLSYHSTGLLVDEQASEVGLGWSLRAGGVIGHTVLGSNDEYYQGFGSGTKVPFPPLSSAPDLYQFYQTATSGIDTEPDLYNFSFGSQSGRFVCDYQGVPHTTPYQDIKIEGAGRDNTVLTDVDGTRYVYAGYNERTKVVYGSYCPLPPPGNIVVDSKREVVSARYLSQIISPTRDTIRLSYLPDTTTYRVPADYTITRIKSAAGCRESILNQNNIGQVLCQNAILHYGYHLSTITSRNGITVRFLYDRVRRRDCVGGHRLQAVEVTDGNRTQRYDFYQSYFASTDTREFFHDSVDVAARYRLRLDSVRQRGLPAYRLRYQQNAAYDFPRVGSFAQDVMGYYNGQDLNSALLSANMYQDTLSVRAVTLEPTPVPGVNRRIDTLATRQGMLQRITYPAGGYSDLTYEAHQQLVNRFFPVDSLGAQFTVEVGVNDEINANSQATKRQSLQLTKPGRIHLQCHLWIANGQPTSQPITPQTVISTACSVTLQDSVSGRTIYTMPPGPYNDSTTAELPAGRYRVTVSVSDVNQQEALLDVAASTLYRKQVYVGNYPFYGCRIKYIVNSGKTPLGQDERRLFKYCLTKPITISSGAPLDTVGRQYHLEVGVHDGTYSGNSHTERRTLRLTRPGLIHLQCAVPLFNGQSPNQPLPSGAPITSGYFVSLRDSASGTILYTMPNVFQDDRYTSPLAAGTYLLTVNASDSGTNEVLLTVSATVHYSQPPVTVPPPRTLANPSSGYVLYRPTLWYTKDHIEHWTIDQPWGQDTRLYYCNYSVLSQSPINPTNTVHGGNIAYSQVQVVNKSATGDLLTDYVYSFPKDLSSNVLKYPFPPPTSFDWQRGRLLRQTVFTNRSGTYVPAKLTRYTYRKYFDEAVLPSPQNPGGNGRDVYQPAAAQHFLTIVPACRVYTVMDGHGGFGSTAAGSTGGGSGGAYFLPIYRGFFYYYVSAFDYLAQTDETLYGPAGDSITTHQAFQHSSPVHTQPVVVKAWGSAGDTLTNTLTYASDYRTRFVGPASPSLNALQALDAQHQRTAVVENVGATVHADGTRRYTAAHLSEYAVQQGVPLLRKTWEWQVNPANTFQPYLTGNAAAATPQDANYRLRQTIAHRPDYSVLGVRPASGTLASVLRARDKEVIAQATNAAANQLAYTSFEPGATGRWRYDSTATSASRVSGGMTGRWAYRLEGGSQANPVYCPNLPAGSYELTYWACGTGVQVFQNGSAAPAVLLRQRPGNWQQYRVLLTLAQGGGNIVMLAVPAGSVLLLDEVRLFPAGAQLTTCTHEPLVGLTSQTDSSGRLTTYEYDELGRLLRTRDEQGHILGQQQYHYAGH